MSESVPYMVAMGRARRVRARAPLAAFNNDVHVIAEDGCTFWFRNAILVELPDGWIAVLPEHHPIHVYVKDDLLHFQMYTPIPPMAVVESDIYGG